MLTPSDMIGTIDNVSLGQTPAVQNQDAFSQLLSLLENDGRGVYTASDLVTRLKALSTVPNNAPAGYDLSTYFDFYSTQGFVSSLGSQVAVSQQYQKPDGTTGNIANVAELFGPNFPVPQPTTNPFDVSFFLSKTPFFNPATRNAKRGEIFLNSMPPVVLASLVPFLQVEFQFTRSPSPLLNSPGMMKFLMGAVPVASAGDANNAMITAHQVPSATSGGDSTDMSQLDFAGMEMFTAPQTLTNPQPNLNVGANGTRYVDVVDPFRPFGSIEHLVVRVVPMGKGFFTYKTATLTLKIHDRSRLTDITDLLRPQTYPGVAVWVTYGWRAPVRPGNNPYFDYINNSMLMREAYSIINSNFSFDNVGQVTMTLELSTTGVHEAKASAITDLGPDLTWKLKQLHKLNEDVTKYLSALNLGSKSGVLKEIRAFQKIDAAESQIIPSDLPAQQDISSAINALTPLLSNTSGVDQTNLSNLVSTLKQYQTQGFTSVNSQGKFNLIQSYENSVSDTVGKLFNEMLTGTDPFLPSALKTSMKPSPADLITLITSYNKPPVQQVIKTAKRSVVSFGKLLSVFAVNNLMNAGTVDELQVFTYTLNEMAGYSAGINIAAFPIDMNMFVDQYSDHVKRNGGQRMTLEEFMELAVNAQFGDPRALGYGMTSLYKPFNLKDPVALKDDRQGTSASQLDQWQKLHGIFKQPEIEFYIEVTHQKVSDTGYNDILQYINYSATSTSTLSSKDLQGLASKRIMRLHIYDKQVTPYKAETQLLHRDDGNGFFMIPPSTASDVATQTTTDITKNPNFQNAVKNGVPPSIAASGQQATNDVAQMDAILGMAQLNIASNQQVKDLISKAVPTIRYGANGTTIKSAHLASTIDPKMSSAMMTRQATLRNDAAPNGSAEGGVPVTVIPAKLELTTLGNPLATMAQNYFVDFGTGTTLDNIYIVTNVTHTIGPGKFETQWEMCFQDGYSTFQGAQTIQNYVAQNPTTIPGAPPP